MDAKGIQALLTEADGFYSAHSEVMTLVCGLAAALKASEERAEKAEHQRDEFAAANLAANKRIVELEQERDAAHQQLREIAESYNAEHSAGGEPPPALTCMLLALKQIRDQKQQMRDGFNCLMAERDAARAELAQPSICPNCTAKLRRLDRMDAAGRAAYELDRARKDAAGQNKRAQKAEQEAKALRAELEAERRKGCSNG